LQFDKYVLAKLNHSLCNCKTPAVSHYILRPT